jgi:hypothetical protein
MTEVAFTIDTRLEMIALWTAKPQPRSTDSQLEPQIVNHRKHTDIVAKPTQTFRSDAPHHHGSLQVLDLPGVRRIAKDPTGGCSLECALAFKLA